MKSLEDLQHQRYIYDEIGSGEKTLLQERQDAKKAKASKVPKFRIEKYRYRNMEGLHDRKFASTLDITVNS